MGCCHITLGMVLSAKTENWKPTLLHCCPTDWAASVSDKRGFLGCHFEGCILSPQWRATCDQRAASWGPVSPAIKGIIAYRAPATESIQKVSKVKISRATVSLCTASSGYYSQEGNSTHHSSLSVIQSQLTRVGLVAACFLGIRRTATYTRMHTHRSAQDNFLQLTMATSSPAPWKCQWRRFLDQETQ